MYDPVMWLTAAKPSTTSLPLKRSMLVYQYMYSKDGYLLDCAYLMNDWDYLYKRLLCAISAYWRNDEHCFYQLNVYKDLAC